MNTLYMILSHYECHKKENKKIQKSYLIVSRKEEKKIEISHSISHNRQIEKRNQKK